MAALNMTQTIVELATPCEKREKLMEMLNGEADPEGTMIFVKDEKSADGLAAYLSESEHPATSIHGYRRHYQRVEALEDFNSGRMQILLTNDVDVIGKCVYLFIYFNHF